MKRFIAILLLCCYAAGVFGMDISLHYCGGAFQSISFKAGEGNACCSKKNKKMRCCKDKVLSYKLSEKHSAQHHIQHHFAAGLVAVLPVGYLFSSTTYLPVLKVYAPVSHAPPDLHGPGLYLLHNVFLI